MNKRETDMVNSSNQQVRIVCTYCMQLTILNNSNTVYEQQFKEEIISPAAQASRHPVF